MQAPKEVVAVVEAVAVVEVEVAAAMKRKHHHLVWQAWVLSSKTWCLAQLCKNLRKDIKLDRSEFGQSFFNPESFVHVECLEISGSWMLFHGHLCSYCFIYLFLSICTCTQSLPWMCVEFQWAFPYNYSSGCGCDSHFTFHHNYDIVFGLQTRCS